VTICGAGAARSHTIFEKHKIVLLWLITAPSRKKIIMQFCPTKHNIFFTHAGVNQEKYFLLMLQFLASLTKNLRKPKLKK
jgi:hypothetical protein